MVKHTNTRHSDVYSLFKDFGAQLLKLLLWNLQIRLDYQKFSAVVDQNWTFYVVVFNALRQHWNLWYKNLNRLYSKMYKMKIYRRFWFSTSCIKITITVNQNNKHNFGKISKSLTKQGIYKHKWTNSVDIFGRSNMGFVTGVNECTRL